MWKNLAMVAVSMLIIGSVLFPTDAFAVPYSWKDGNAFRPASPQEWQNYQRDSVGQLVFKHIGEFKKTGNTLDLSKYTPDEICFGYPYHLQHVSRQTKVIVLPGSTLVRVKEYPAPTVKDMVMDFNRRLYFLTHPDQRPEEKPYSLD
jgi:hypothetical protein